MKHIFLGLLPFFILLSACDCECDCEDDSGKKGNDKKKVVKTDVTDSLKVKPSAQGLEGIKTVCDCYSESLAMQAEYDSVSDPSDEFIRRDAELTIACDAIRKDIGESAFQEEMLLCYEADSISKTLDLGDFKSCDCVSSTKKLMDFAGAGKDIPEEIIIDMDKCKLLQAEIGMKQYLLEAEGCQK